jgi:hypothetical protein
MLNNFIKHQSNVVPTSGRLGYRDRGRTTSELSTPSNVKVAELSNRENSIFVLEPAHRVLSSLLSALLLERWIFTSFIEERLKCRLEMPQRLLRGNTRNFFKPFSFIGMTQLCKDSGGLNVVDLFPVCVSISSDLQHCVVRPTTRSEHTRKHRSLLDSGIKSESLAHLHKNSVQLVRSKVKRKDDAIPLPAKAGSLLAQNQ